MREKIAVLAGTFALGRGLVRCKLLDRLAEAAKLGERNKPGGARPPGVPTRFMTGRLPSSTGVLASGGLDSSILVGHLLRERRRVQPFYVRTGLNWQQGELPALSRFLAAVATDDLAELVILDLPLADLYAGHWSLTGRAIPSADSPDESVFLPGRNALLIVKAAVWCQLHGIGELAMAPLGTSPFGDASEDFFRDFEAAINHGSQRKVRLTRPFGHMNKRQVMALGRGLPLELTMSCLAPGNGLHCGKCNKCAERQTAFRESATPDPTEYAAPGLRPLTSNL